MKRCEALGSTHCRLHHDLFRMTCMGVNVMWPYHVLPMQSFWRRNAYDEQWEYWVVVRETGKRTAESTWEQQHTREKQATKPTFQSALQTWALANCFFFRSLHSMLCGLVGFRG